MKKPPPKEIKLELQEPPKDSRDPHAEQEAKLKRDAKANLRNVQLITTLREQLRLAEADRTNGEPAMLEAICGWLDDTTQMAKVMAEAKWQGVTSEQFKAWWAAHRATTLKGRDQAAPERMKHLDYIAQLRALVMARSGYASAFAELIDAVENRINLPRKILDELEMTPEQVFTAYRNADEIVERALSTAKHIRTTGEGST